MSADCKRAGGGVRVSLKTGNGVGFQKLDQPPKGHLLHCTLEPHPTLQPASLASISLFSTLRPRPHPSQNEPWTLAGTCAAMPLHMLAPPSCSMRETPSHPPKAHSQPPMSHSSTKPTSTGHTGSPPRVAGSSVVRCEQTHQASV